MLLAREAPERVVGRRAPQSEQALYVPEQVARALQGLPPSRMCDPGAR